MGTVKSKSVKGAKFFSEGGLAGDKPTVMGRDRVAPMAAVDEMTTGKRSPLRSGTSGEGGGGSGDTRGFGEKLAGKLNQIASGKSGQKRSMDDDAATRRRNTAKK